MREDQVFSVRTVASLVVAFVLMVAGLWVAGPGWLGAGLVIAGGFMLLVAVRFGRGKWPWR